MSIAGRCFDAQLEWISARSKCEDAIMAAMGIDPNIVADDPMWPFEDFIFDYYDQSFELTSVNDGWEPSLEILERWWNLGFLRCWLNYKNGTEKYYYKK